MFDKITLGISKVASFLEKVVKYAAMAVLVVLLCAIFFQVVRRVITGKSYTEIEELSIVMAAWLGFLTLAYAARKRVHVRIDVFASKLPLSVQRLLDILVSGVTLYASLELVRYGWALAQKKVQVPLAILPINAGWWYIAFPIGMAFTSFFLFEHILQEIKTLRDEKKGSAMEGLA